MKNKRLISLTEPMDKELIVLHEKTGWNYSQLIDFALRLSLIKMMELLTKDEN